ncbi:unnamed protein product [Arctogadus glacialis]
MEDQEPVSLCLRCWCLIPGAGLSLIKVLVSQTRSRPGAGFSLNEVLVSQIRSRSLSDGGAGVSDQEPVSRSLRCWCLRPGADLPLSEVLVSQTRSRPGAGLSLSEVLVSQTRSRLGQGYHRVHWGKMGSPESALEALRPQPAQQSSEWACYPA